jgi:ABC-type glycerol-3-phosphate transport system substrate-binding protein
MYKKDIKLKLVFIGLILIFIATTAFGCKTTVSKEAKEKIQPVTLNYWRVWDGQDAFNDIISAYNALHSNITINYRKLRYEEYEQELIDGFAEDRGPDIFSVNAGWLRRYQSKISPLPEQTTMAYSVITGTLQKQETVELRASQSITAKQLKENYVDVAADNAIVDGKIYGLPLSVDTMVVFYNRDLLNSAGITEIPRYWDEKFLSDVKKLTKQDKDGKIVQSGTALGTAGNIERYSDILSLIMMQNGAEMITPEGVVSFHRLPAAESDKSYVPGLEALRFYTDFANPVKEVYAWNKDLPNSLEAFINGRLAFFFGYSYHLPQIKARAPRLNLGISPMLQIEGNPTTVNFANFWLETVSAKSKYQNEAWDFIQFATNAENVKSYLTTAQRPTALRALINEQTNDENLAVFANQLLTARAWYKGKDYNAAEVIMGDMIDQALVDPKQMPKLMETAARKIQQTIQ